MEKILQRWLNYAKKYRLYRKKLSQHENQELFIHNIFSGNKINLDEIIECFGQEINKVTLGFVPEDADGYEIVEIHEENTTFFVKGECFAEFEVDKLRISTLSHA